jgi:hypothetical protein
MTCKNLVCVRTQINARSEQPADICVLLIVLRFEKEQYKWVMKVDLERVYDAETVTDILSSVKLTPKCTVLMNRCTNFCNCQTCFV